MSKIPLNPSLICAAIAGRASDCRMHVEDLTRRGNPIEVRCFFPEPFDKEERERTLAALSPEQREKVQARIAEQVVRERAAANRFAQEIRGWLEPFEIDFVQTEIFYGIRPGHEDKGEVLWIYVVPPKDVREQNRDI